MRVRSGSVHSKWIVAISCSLIHFLTSIPTRCGGVLFLAIMSCYEADRNRASVPIVLITLTRTLVGPLTGILSQKFELYTITTIGWVLTILGVGCCFFAETLTEVIIFLGLIHGAGLGLGLPLIPQIINQHFDKHFDKANGLSLAGTCIGAFLMPPVIEFLLQNYGTPGAFLMLSGIILHCIPASMLLSQASLLNPEKVITKTNVLKIYPKEVDDNMISNEGCIFNIHLSVDAKESKQKTVDKQREGYENCVLPIHFAPVINNTKEESKNEIVEKQKESKQNGFATRNKIGSTAFMWPHNKLKQFDINHAKICSDNILSNGNLKKHSSPKLLRWNSNEPCLKRGDSKISEITLQIDTLKEVLDSIRGNNTEENSISKLRTFLRKAYNSLCNIFPCYGKTNGIRSKSLNFNKSSENCGIARISRSYTEISTSTKHIKLLLSPSFLLITFVQGSHAFIASIMWTVILDFCNDKGISRRSAIYILMFLPLAELIGSVGFGWVTDSKHLTRAKYLFVCFSALAFVSGSLVFLNGFVFVLSGCLAFGFLSGTSAVVFPGVIIEVIDKEMKEFALSARLFLYAPMSLTISPLVGYFRGSIGSYDGIFYILSILSGLCGVLSLLVPHVSTIKQASLVSK